MAADSARRVAVDGACALQDAPSALLIRPEETFGFRLWLVVHAWQRRLEAALAPLDLTHMQFVVLALASWLGLQGETPSQSRIATYGRIDRMTLSNVLRLLEEKGYVQRRTHPCDPRANWVALTDAGEAAIREAKQLAWTTQESFFGRLGPDGGRALAEQLDALLRFEKCGPGDTDKTVTKSVKTGG